MRVAQEKLDSMVRMLREMGARRILLFGSFVTVPEQARDVEAAVEGIPVNRILDADVAVHEILQVPTDLVSREENEDFFQMIVRYGRALFAAE